MMDQILELDHGSGNRRLTNRSRETVPLSLFVKHHFTARLFQYILLCSLHEAEGAATPLPHAVHLCCHLTVIHQWGHTEETRHHFQEHLQGGAPIISSHKTHRAQAV